MLKLVLGVLGSFFTSSVKTVSNDIKEAYQSKLNAANDAERIAADERINILEARKSIIQSAQSDRAERWVRIGFGVLFLAYNAKLIVWDKLLEWGTTDPLSPELAYIQMTVLGGYFLLANVKAIRK